MSHIGKHSSPMASFSAQCLVENNEYLDNLRTIICVKDEMLLTKPISFKEMVQVADDCISTLASINSFIYQIVHLSWYRWAADAKQPAFPGGFKENWSWLMRVARVVELKFKMQNKLAT